MSLPAGLTIDLLIKLLVIPLLLLAIILLYRLDRILDAGMHSAEAIEKTTDNIEKSSETVFQAARVLRKIPFVNSEES